MSDTNERLKDVLVLAKSYKKELGIGVGAAFIFFCSFIIPVYSQNYSTVLRNKQIEASIQEGDRVPLKEAQEVNFNNLDRFYKKNVAGPNYDKYIDKSDSTPISDQEALRQPWLVK